MEDKKKKKSHRIEAKNTFNLEMITANKYHISHFDLG